MAYDLHDTIAAVASAAGGAARGVVRISGPDAVKLLARCFQPTGGDFAALTNASAPQRIRGAMRVAGIDGGPSLSIPGALLIWPGAQSYTRQQSAEFHMIGSPPLLSAVLDELGRRGIRPAEPGEFTLRAFVAGRIDLTQAEGVLGVIDAQGRGDLDAALDQVAGGLSRPLHQIREDLLSLLAELEAGLDFVEEDIEFISRQSLTDRIASAHAVVAATRSQLSDRDQCSEVPRIVLVGAPNAGKSSLFNALLDRYGDGAAASSIVSDQPGATRDYVIGRLQIGDMPCELVDTAGIDEVQAASIAEAAQAASGVQCRAADLRLLCIEAGGEVQAPDQDGEVLVFTKIDQKPTAAPASASIGCSSVTGAGLDALAARIRAEIGRLGDRHECGAAVAATSARCHGSLQLADESLQAAAALVAAGCDELLAAEIRSALDALGEIVGAICADDVLDRVFGQFCIGK
jgi:tRNA modification GTPase